MGMSAGRSSLRYVNWRKQLDWANFFNVKSQSGI